MSTWLRNAWYVAAWDAEVDQVPLARTICGVPMMFYRRIDRQVVKHQKPIANQLQSNSRNTLPDDIEAIAELLQPLQRTLRTNPHHPHSGG